MKKLIFLTGNGASIKFGIPSTECITNLIRNKINDEHPQLIPLYDRIVNELESYTQQKPIDFERIYEAVDTIYQFVYLGRECDVEEERCERVNRYRPFYAPFVDLKCSISNDNVFNQDDITLLRDKIFKNIILVTHAFARKTNEAQYRSLKGMFSKLLEDYNIISATLNYDDIIDRTFEDMHTDIFTGFVKSEKDYCIYDRSSLINAIKYPINMHLHLHGSLRWGDEPDCIIREYPTSDKAIENNSFGIPSGISLPNKEIFKRGTIITGIEKVEGLSSSLPFYDYLSAFNILCADADAIIIAGYGFGDQHINRAVCYSRTYNDNKPIVYLVDYDNSNIPPHNWSNGKGNIHRVDLPLLLGVNRVHNGYNNGWYKLDGESNSTFSASELYLWLGGFSSFCDDVAKNGLPNF